MNAPRETMTPEDVRKLVRAYGLAMNDRLATESLETYGALMSAIRLLCEERDAAKEQVSLLTDKANWWDNPWVPVTVDAQRKLLDERSALQVQLVRLGTELAHRTGDIADLQAQAEEMRKYIRHLDGCDWYNDGKCICGCPPDNFDLWLAKEQPR